MQPSDFERHGFAVGVREGFVAFLPVSVGLIPWALVVGMAMTSAGFTPLQAMGMNIIVFAGTAQLGTLPLIVDNAPLWLIVATGLALNLRFLIFSAGIAPGFRGIGTGWRWLCGHLLTDGSFAVCYDKLMQVDNPSWRLGFYLITGVWTWLLWQAFTLAGIFAAGIVPKSWSLEFMATIALIVLLVPMAKARPMLVAALVGGGSAVLLRGMPLRLGIVTAICLGIAAGFAAEHWQEKKTA